MRRLMLALATLVITVVAVELGAWWAPFIAGNIIGSIEPRFRVTIPTGAVIGLLAWGLPLEFYELRYGLGPTAQSLAAIMGFTQASEVPVILTCVVGLLLGLSGAWIGSAVKSLVGRQPAISR